MKTNIRGMSMEGLYVKGIKELLQQKKETLFFKMLKHQKRIKKLQFQKLILL